MLSGFFSGFLFFSRLFLHQFRSQLWQLRVSVRWLSKSCCRRRRRHRSSSRVVCKESHWNDEKRSPPPVVQAGTGLVAKVALASADSGVPVLQTLLDSLHPTASEKNHWKITKHEQSFGGGGHVWQKMKFQHMSHKPTTADRKRELYALAVYE